MTALPAGLLVVQGLGDLVRRGSSREARIISILLLLSFFATLAIVLSALVVVFDAYSPLPYWDQWEFISPAVIFRRYFEQHNEHRILLTKLITLVDQTVFGGSNLLNLFVIYLAQALNAWFLIVLAWRAGLRSYPEIVPAALVAVGALFTLHQYENLTWGFQTQFVIVFAAATAAFLSLARHADTRRPISLALTILACAIATCEMANGVLVGLIAGAMAMALRLSWRVVALLTLTAALLLGAYLINYSPIAFHSNVNESLTHPLQLIGYVLIYVGGIAARTLTAGFLGFVGRHIEETTLAIVCGGVVCLVNALIFARIVAKRAEIGPAVYALLSINLFIVATAAITGLGRVSLGLEQALASRYSTGGGIMIAVTFILALALAAPLRIGRPMRVAAAASFALLGLLLAAQPRFIRAAEQRRIGNDLATSALLAEVSEEVALHHTFLHVDYVIRGASYLKGRNLSIYADPWSGWLGHALTEFSPLPQSVCDGKIDAPEAVAHTDGARVTGAVSLSPFILRPRVILVDGRQQAVGYAFVQYHLDLIRIYRPQRRPTVETGWIGHVQQNYTAPLRAVLMDRNNNLICFIGSS
jgi:hypothetical protein